MSPFRTTFLAVALVSSLVVLQAHANSRVFVASTGSDANTASNCTFANPCRSFAAAMTVVDPGGEILALDAAGFGAVTITKSVSIIANPGSYAGISASTGNAVTIATAGVNVVLRGLNINGIGGSNGVVMTNGASLAVENCVIANFGGDGIILTASGANVRVTNTTFRGNFNGIEAQAGTVDVRGSTANGHGQAGFFVASTTAATTVTMSVTDSTTAGNVYGLVSASFTATAVAKMSATRTTASGNSNVGFLATGADATLTVGSSMATGNATGLSNGGGVLESLGNNQVRMNGSNTSGTITAIAGT